MLCAMAINMDFGLFVVFFKNKTLVLVCVLGWKVSWDKLTTPITEAIPEMYSQMYLSDGFPKMPSGRTIPIRPPSRSRWRHRSINKTWGGCFSSNLFVRIHLSPFSHICPRWYCPNNSCPTTGIFAPNGGFVRTTSKLQSWMFFWVFLPHLSGTSKLFSQWIWNSSSPIKER